MSPEHLLGLVEEARHAYELVVVEIGPLFSALPGGAGADRFAAGRAVLAGADIAVVFAGPDPESSVRMGEWRVTANEVGCRARCLGVFARLPAGRGSDATIWRSRWTTRLARPVSSRFDACRMTPGWPGPAGTASWSPPARG